MCKLVTGLLTKKCKLFSGRDKADLILDNDVSTTTFEKPPGDIFLFPNGVTSYTSKDNKVFYESADGLKEYSLKDRINSVLDFGGILHMKSGAKYVIRDRTIIGIGIHQGIVEPYRKIDKNKIEKKFGKASKIKKDCEETDGELWNIIYFFESKNMIINFFEPDNEIIFINIGLFPYSRDKQPS